MGSKGTLKCTKAKAGDIITAVQLNNLIKNIQAELRRRNQETNAKQLSSSFVEPNTTCYASTMSDIYNAIELMNSKFDAAAAPPAGALIRSEQFNLIYDEVVKLVADCFCYTHCGSYSPCSCHGHCSHY